MRTHKKTWLACLLAVAMLLSLVPMTALATGDAVTDEAGLRAAIAEGGEITIGADLIITDAITIDKDVVINLNGYSVSLPAGMGFSAEAAFIVNGADVAVNDGRLGYAGSGSLFKLVAVADATTSLTVNGVSCTAHDNWNEGVQVYPTSLFASPRLRVPLNRPFRSLAALSPRRFLTLNRVGAYPPARLSAVMRRI